MYIEEDNIYLNDEQRMFIISLLKQQKEDIKNKLKPEIIDHLTCGNEKCFYDGEWCYHLTDKEFNKIFE